jgi:NADPH:quinone reductase-like Zn-dependent oxidoreductase
VTFSFKVTDPCRTSTIDAITLTSPWDVVLGTVSEQTYSEAVDSAATAQGTATICGPRKYEVLENNLDSEIVTITDLGGGSYKLVATSQSEIDEGPHDLVLRVTFQNYPLATNAAYP